MRYEFVINGEKKLILWPDNNLETSIFEEFFRDTKSVVVEKESPQSQKIVIKKLENDKKGN